MKDDTSHTLPNNNNNIPNNKENVCVTWQMLKYGVQFNMTMTLSGLFSLTFLSFVVTTDII